MIIPLLVLILSAEPTPADPGVGALLEKLGVVQHVTSSFVQEDLWALTLEEERSSGTLTFSHDGRFLLEYTDPGGRVLGFDGTEVFSVEPASEQVILYGEAEGSGIRSVLSSIESPSGDVSTSISGDTVLIEMEGDLGQGLVFMSIGYQLADSLPCLFETRDVNGNTSRWILLDPSIPQSIPEDLYSARFPEGFEVVDQGLN